jgi:hypothetical protein
MNRTHGFAEIEIGGRKRPVKYGWNTLVLLEERTGVNTLHPRGIDNALFKAVFQTAIVEIGLTEGCRVTDDKVDFIREDIGDWIDNEGILKVSEFVKLFRETITDVSVKGMSDQQKKSLGLTSKTSPSGDSASVPKPSGT